MTTETRAQTHNRLSQAILDAKSPGEKDRAIDRYKDFMAKYNEDMEEQDDYGAGIGEGHPR